MGSHHAPLTRDTPILSRRGGYTTTNLSQIRSEDDWTHILCTHTHGEFAVLADCYDADSCPPCMYVSGVASLRPSLIQHYTCGGWQDTLEVQECLDGIFKLLRLNPFISLIQPLEAA